MKCPAQPTTLFQRSIALALVLCIALLTLASVSPSLHGHLHGVQGDGCAGHSHCQSEESSDDDSHRCAVTLLETGSTPFTVITTAGFEPLWVDTLTRIDSHVVDFLFRAHSGARAPPVAVFV